MNYYTNTLFFIILVAIPFQIYSQVNQPKFRLDLELQSLSISHQDNYFYREGLDGNPSHRVEGLKRHSSSYGFQTLLSYRLRSSIRISSGVGYHRIAIHGLSGLNQGRLPADRRSDTYELVISPKTTYHIAQVPAILIFDFLSNEIVHPSIKFGVAGEYYFRANYTAKNFEKYSGPVPKNDFAGWSSFVGLEVLVKLSDRWSAKVGYDYTLTNPEYVDDILFNQGSVDAGVGTYGIPLTFNYQVLKVGLGLTL